MSEYLGVLGSLVDIDCAETESVSTPKRGDSFLTMGGMLYTAIPAREHRTWSRSVDTADSAEVGKLKEFSAGAWGPGPFHWVSIAAAHGNLLTPRESMCLDYRRAAGFSDGGPIGGAARSILTSSSINDTIWSSIPVVPGVPLTASVMSWGAGVVFRVLSATGAILENRVIPVGDGSVTIPSVPAGGFQAVILSQPGTTRVARPQVTYTTRRVPWTVGDGCRQALVHVPDVSTLLAVRDRPMIQSVTMTVQEVGLP